MNGASIARGLRATLERLGDPELDRYVGEVIDLLAQAGEKAVGYTVRQDVSDFGTGWTAPADVAPTDPGRDLESIPMANGFRFVEEKDLDVLGRRRFVLRDEIGAYGGSWPENKARRFANAVPNLAHDDRPADVFAAPPAASLGDLEPRFYWLDEWQADQLDRNDLTWRALKRVGEGHAVVHVEGMVRRPDATPERPLGTYDVSGVRLYVDRGPTLGRAS